MRKIRLSIWKAPRQFSLLACVVFGVFALFSTIPAAYGEEGDDEYIKLFAQIQDAETLASNGQTAPALQKFQSLQIELAKFKREFPRWNPAVITVRQKFVGEEIAALTAKLSPPEPKAENKAPQGQNQGTSSAGTTQAGAAKIKLIAPGNEPRAQFRFEPKAGEKQESLVAAQSTVNVKMGDTPIQDMNLPEMTFDIQLTISAVSPDGNINYELLMKEAKLAEGGSVPPPLGETLKSAFAAMKGMTGSGTLTSRGILTASIVKPVAVSDPSVQQMMGQFREMVAQSAVPLPEEAIGVGAKWEAAVPLTSQGVKLVQKTTFELVSVEGKKLKLRTTGSQVGTNQKVENPGMPGMKMDVIKLTGNGTGEVTLDLAKMLPVEGQTAISTETVMSMDVAGQKQQMTIHNSIKSRVTTP